MRKSTNSSEARKICIRRRMITPFLRHNFIAMPKMAVSHKRAEDVEDDTTSKLRRVVVHVVRRRDFDDFHAAYAFGSDGVDHLKSLAREQPARLGRPCSRCEAGINRIDVERQVNCFATLPSHLESYFGSLLGAVGIDVMHG